VSVRTLLLKALYWLAVLVISLALLVLLVLFFEARDSSDLEGSKRRSESGSATVAPGLEHVERPRAALVGRA
jgi:hypothetical protein